MRVLCLTLIFAALLATPVYAEEADTGKDNALGLPRFAVMRFSEINLRTGPGTRYPIDWVYRRVGLPVEVINSFDTWYRIRDIDGTEGWVHKTQLRFMRHGMAVEKLRTVRVEPDDKAAPVAHLEPGVIFALNSCTPEWCEVVGEEYKGYLRKSAFYGAYPQEKFD